MAQFEETEFHCKVPLEHALEQSNYFFFFYEFHSCSAITGLRGSNKKQNSFKNTDPDLDTAFYFCNKIGSKLKPLLLLQHLLTHETLIYVQYFGSCRLNGQVSQHSNPQNPAIKSSVVTQCFFRLTCNTSYVPQINALSSLEPKDWHGV